MFSELAEEDWAAEGESVDQPYLKRIERVHSLIGGFHYAILHFHLQILWL